MMRGSRVELCSLGGKRNITVTCVKVTDTLEVEEGLACIKGNQSNGVKPKEDVLEFNIGNALPNRSVAITV